MHREIDPITTASRTLSEVMLDAGGVDLPGVLAMPRDEAGTARGIVLFAHGSGSSRYSPRNRYVASELTRAGFASLLFDLLTPGESNDRERVFDIPLLTRRLLAGVRWAGAAAATRGLALGLFGASTGAAAALRAAAQDHGVRAVVSRGGRPDLAMDVLPLVAAPTLLIVGGQDHDVLRLNRLALAALGGTKHLAVVPAATHLFEEPGTLEQVAALAARWFTLHLAGEVTP